MSAPAGWYPDPTGVTGVTGERWWDGTQWTAYERAAPYAPAGMWPKVQVDTNTVWVWLAIAVTALPYATLFLVDGGGYLHGVLQSGSSAAVSGMIQWQLQTLAVSMLGWVAMGAGIVFSWLDWRELRRRGVSAAAKAGRARAVPLGMVVLRVARRGSGGLHDRSRRGVATPHRLGRLAAAVGLDRRHRHRLRDHFRLVVLVHRRVIRWAHVQLLLTGGSRAVRACPFWQSLGFAPQLGREVAWSRPLVAL